MRACDGGSSFSASTPIKAGLQQWHFKNAVIDHYFFFLKKKIDYQKLIFGNQKFFIFQNWKFIKKMNMRNSGKKKKKNYFPFFSYINLVYLSLRFTKIQIHAPKIYKTNRHWTWFSYALKPNTKTQTQIFSTHMQSNTKHNTYFPIFSENLKNNEQNPIFSQTHSYSISRKEGSTTWVSTFWISGDIDRWQHERDWESCERAFFILFYFFPSSRTIQEGEFEISYFKYSDFFFFYGIFWNMP